MQLKVGGKATGPEAAAQLAVTSDLVIRAPAAATQLLPWKQTEERLDCVLPVM